jgi:signal transduction histidine kinase
MSEMNVTATAMQEGVTVAEGLAEHAGRLARRLEALEDFASLLAHDVKSSLVVALREDDPREGVTRALELVDSVLEAVRADQSTGGSTDIAASLQDAVSDLRECQVHVVSSVAGEFPLPAEALRLVLRNLLANAIAAGARQIHVSAVAHGDRQLLVVDDDGVGLDSAGRYATGAQLGLALCRRLVERCGCALELRPRSVRGSRAVIVAPGGAT